MTPLRFLSPLLPLKSPDPYWIKPSWIEPGLILLLTLLGLALRLVQLNQIPPGLHFDEAVYGLLARDILDGARPIFFAAWTGREPLYMYIMAGVFSVMSVTTLAIRVTSALIGAATIPIVWLLGRQLFSPRVGLLAAAIVTVNYWHLTVSRNGYPNILIPPLSALSLFFLWRAYINHSNPATENTEKGREENVGAVSNRTFFSRGKRDLRLAGLWLLGGIFGGLTLYTYLASRFFAVSLAAIAGYAILVDFGSVRRRAWGFVLASVAFFLTLSPLAWYFTRHPHDFWERADQVLIFKQADATSVPGLLLSNVTRTLLGFFWPGSGDPRWHYNYSGKPVLDALLALALLAGILICLRHWRRLPYPFMLLWFFISWLPGVLTLDLQPAGQRLFGVIPPLALLIALGLSLAWERLAETMRARGRMPLLVPGLLAALLLLYEGTSSVSVYFGDWGQNPATYQAFMGDMLALAQAAGEAQKRGDTVVILSEHYKHPTVIWENPATQQMHWIDSKAVLSPAQQKLTQTGQIGFNPQPDGQYVTYLIPLISTGPDARVLQMLESGGATLQIIARDPQGKPALGEVRVRQALWPQPISTGTGSFHQELALAGSDVPESFPREGKLEAGVRLEVLQQVAEGRRLAAHLVDAQGEVWAQDDRLAYLTEQWRTGDQWEQWLSFTLDPAMPPGPYTVQLFLADEAGHPLPVQDQFGRLVGLSLSAGTVQITPQGGSIQPVAAVGRIVAPGLKLLEGHVMAESVAPGAQFPIGITWQGTADARSATEVNIEVVGADGKVWGQTSRPIVAAYSPPNWQPGEEIKARYGVKVPADAPGGKSQVRIAVEGNAAEVVGEITVAGIARQFTPPQPRYPQQFTLGGGIEFLGYDLGQDALRAGEKLDLTLYWHARGELQRDSKVFTHLLDAHNQVVAQVDAIPGHGARPVTGWLMGEFIPDPYRIDIPSNVPPGDYTLEIGMYDSQTLARLSIVDAGGAPAPDDRILLGEITIRP
ncbi:MAG: glycosyltransferase family 39 protein [Chloroflexi bacterium]|nr:glycosyltransferase family 39 protein [Chloroflexota bacterium]